ncbi:MAG: bifunctional 4-hydroxy-2-oxoglutarate aldolase/2-dehydro-3-deoxy-phosphogluconate aldolase [Planctomycetes bacterium]|nr:bifunctional 4-hydroxy-2-oxoglutarate aldolase/2-dehydro-3-deoxy-phosphogluconate aldolase [Planctomycetota bacterium]
MTTTNREQIVDQIRRLRVSAIIRTPDRDSAEAGMSAAVAGGFRMIEFTLTTPGALDLIAQFAANPDLLVGAGTVLSTQQACDAVEAGAKFLVSPICDPEVIKQAGELGVPSIPGTATPTEMMLAHRMGADLVKLFPAPANVVRYITSVLGPLPDLRIFPTAGVDTDNLLDVLQAGAAGVGFVRSLFRPTLMDEGRFKDIEARARDIIRLLNKLPSGRSGR